MKRRRLLGFLFAFSLVILSFAGCSGNKDTKETESKEIDIEETNIEENDTKEEGNHIEPLKLNEYILTVDTLEKGVDIGDEMYGLFYEDINFAADGGLYAEMVKNRSFEYEQGKANNGALHGYTVYNEAVLEVMGSDATVSLLRNEAPLNENNPHYLRMTNTLDEPAGFINVGFLDGMSVIGGDSYRFTVYLKSDSYKGSVSAYLKTRLGETIAEGIIAAITDEWVKYELTLTAGEDVNPAQLLVVLNDSGTLDVDMVSLFPHNTYKNRENGLRADLVEMLEGLNPGFIRFPGGCIVEGGSLTTAYNWKDTVGDVAERKQNINIWHGNNAYPYYQSYGLGFYEYFLLCEDLDAAPVPILNCGMACQARTNEVVPLSDLDQYIQDALDLIEFANGSIDTKWGALRAEMGHPEPFNMEYLGIGNEQWQSVYFARYDKFQEVLREKYPEIKLVTSSGPSSGGDLYEYAWRRIDSYQNEFITYADLVDEHYYNAPEWFLQNVYRYDAYDRDGTDVFLGEYAAKANNLYAAVAEAAYMTGLERNADVVKMAAYAPLFGSLVSSQWSPDLIWFNNSTVYGSANYYIQKMFANNMGDYTLKSELTGDNSATAITGKIGLGTWLTSAEFDDVLVVDNETGEVLYENNFDERGGGWLKSTQGDWKIVESSGNQVFAQQNASFPTDNSIMGSAIYCGDVNWSNYTFTCKAKKVSGAEGFLIPFAVKDFNNFYHWNIGGWRNSLSVVEQAQGGTKTNACETVSLNISPVKWYEIKIIVGTDTVECYLDGVLMHTINSKNVLPVYETVSRDESTGDIIVKIVNSTESEAVIHVDLMNADVSGTAKVELLTAENKAAENSLSNPEYISTVTSNMEISKKFDYQAPAYSVSILRIPAGQ